MVIRIKTRKVIKGKERVLLVGITGRTRLDTLAKRYGRKYKLPAFYSTELSKGRLLLIKRDRPLLRIISKWNTWERR